MVVVVVESADGGVVVVAVVLTAFVGVLIIIILGVLKFRVCYLVVVVVINTNTISPSVNTLLYLPSLLQPHQYQFHHDTAST